MKVSVDGSRFHAWFLAARRSSPAEEEVRAKFSRIRSHPIAMASTDLLAQNEGINQARLAELLEIEPITLGRIIDRLETLRLIKRNPHPTDRRRWLLHLMPAARPKLEQVRELGEVISSEALAGVPEDDRQRLLKMLQALKANLTEACDAPIAGTKTSKP